MIDFDFKGGFMNLKGIIFDMDGVIVDTEYQDFLIQKDFIKHLNPKSSYEDSELLVLVGKSYFNLYRLLQQFIGKQYALLVMRDMKKLIILYFLEKKF